MRISAAPLFSPLAELQEHMRSGGFPRCFDSREQYLEWAHDAAGTRHPVLGICHDCLPEYQTAMKRAGRCHFQEAVFFEDPDDGVVGRVPGLSLNELLGIQTW